MVEILNHNNDAGSSSSENLNRETIKLVALMPTVERKYSIWTFQSSATELCVRLVNCI